jgi:hypothetical protein
LRKPFVSGIANYDIISNDYYRGLFQFVPMELRRVDKKFVFAMEQKAKKKNGFFKNTSNTTPTNKTFT